MTYEINGVEVFADVTFEPETGEILFWDFALHAPSRAAIEAVALAKGLMVTQQETRKIILSPAVYDPETGDKTADEVSEIEVLREWVEEVTDANFHYVNVTLTPAELDADGEVITPAVMDPEVNCNLRIGGALATKLAETGWFVVELLLLEWMGLGAPGTVNGKVPGVAVSSVSLVDLSGVATRQGGIA